MSASIHVPVLADEVLRWLAPQPGHVMVDGTLGGGGHTRLLADRVLPRGFVLAMDRDPAATAEAERSLAGLPVKLAHASFCDLSDLLTEIGIDAVDGVLLDLGLSSDQLADREGGFSFDSDGPLDLRFDPNEGEPASGLIARLGADDLANLIYLYGEERYSRRIARKIVQTRRESPLRTSSQLAQLVRSCVPRGRGQRIDPATRTFQALRIGVNNEMAALDAALQRIPDGLKPQGRFVIISFHSLEDRRVKQAFRSDPRLENLTKKPVRPTEAELQRNPRSRSARMRVASRKADG